MNMTKWLLYIGICLGAFIVNACTEATDAIEPAEADKVMLQLQLTLPVNEASRATEWTTEEGTAYENYIDFKDPTKYRIYFFDNDNKYIARFTPSDVVMSETNNYVLYSVEGEVPEALISASKIVSFKVMILGNWDEYKDDELTTVTTIERICSADWATFDYSKDFELAPDKNLIPFYGIHEYKNVAFEYGEITRLEESVTLLRAMAKVEVVLETEGMSFSEVSIYGYNKQGYCAPSGVDSQADYAQDNGKNLALHLVNGKNDVDATSKSCPFLCVKEEADEETWIAYLPEYENVGDKTQDAHIEVRFDIQTDEDEKFIIYFSDDQSDIANHSFSIARNHLYRFNVTIDPKGNLAVEVKNWADIYENNFYF